jgi:acetylornithine deacetylase/succinyl-diaminopimelate desuccinylase-like protein
MLVTAATLAAAPIAPGIDAAKSYREAHAPAILREYCELLSVPNVADDTVNIRRNAELIAQMFAARGVDLDVLEVPGAPPIVTGEITGTPGGRTIGIYVHYDGQPVEPARWSNPPWQPTLYTRSIEDGGTRRPLPRDGEATHPEWRLYARAAGDDKAPLMALLAALDALRVADLPVVPTVRFLFEGEEEVGSPHLREYLTRYRDRLRADVWLICDGPVHQSRRPQLVFGVRGITSLEITVYGATRYLHSGHYGNWAPNPAVMLARLVASMKDADGRVTVAGFYDDVAPLTPADRAALATVPPIDEALRRELGLAATEAANAPLAERLMLPSLNVNGMVCGTVGAEARNVIPNAATASIDVRLVKGNDPRRMQELVVAHVRSRGYHVVDEAPDLATRRRHERVARVTRGGGYPATRSRSDHPVVPALRRAARAASGGEEVILTPTMGGSLPLYLFEEILDAPTIIVPIANHDDNQHAPDENLRLANLWYGVDLMAGVLTAE